MKIAYIGLDQSCLKAQTFFQSNEDDVTYFLKEKNQNLPFLPFDTTDFFVDQLMIPADSKFQTRAHLEKLDLIQNKYKELKRFLAPFKPVPEQESTNLNSGQIVDLILIQDIQFDSKNKKVFIEIQKKGVEAFDYVYIEAHPFISSFLASKKINIFKTDPINNYVWSSLNFEIDFVKPVEQIKIATSFFLIVDSSRNSLIDNWFFCYLQGKKMSVWTFLPYNQVGNPEFQKFYRDRTRQYISDKLNFIHLKDYLDSTVSTAGVYHKATRFKIRQVDVAPNFLYCSSAQVRKYFKAHQVTKIKEINKMNAESL